MRYIPEEVEDMVEEMLAENRRVMGEMNKRPGRRSNKDFYGNRGTAGDIAFLAGAGSMAIFFGMIIVHYVFTTIFQSMLAVPVVSDSAGTYINASLAIFNNLDWISLVWFVGVIVTLIVTSFFTQGKPVLITGYVVVIIFSVFLSMLTSNFWEALTATNLSTSLAYFPAANHFMLNLPFYVALAGVVGLIFSFAKPVDRAEGFA